MAAPAIAAPRAHRPLPTAASARATKQLHAKRVHAPTSKVDPSLARAHGPVTVMIELTPTPAMVSYAHARAATAAERRARVQAFHSHAASINRLQRTVVAQFAHAATRAHTLFSVQNVYDGIAARTDAAHLSALAGIAGVKAIHLLTPKKMSTTVTVPLINAPQVWAGAGNNTGGGVRIGIIDSGLDYTHADFGGPGGTVGPTGHSVAYDTARTSDNAPLTGVADPTYAQATAPSNFSRDSAKVVGGWDFVGDAYDPAAGTPGDTDTNVLDATPSPDANPLDCNGHGSHVAGIAAGFGVNADGSTFTGPYSGLSALSPSAYQAKFKIGPGVAPGAQLFPLKIFGCGDNGSDLVSKAIDWAAAPGGDPTKHLDVINLSLGGDFASPLDPDSVAADNAVLAGITVVAAAGNSGDEEAVAGAPGDAVRAIAVAASDDTQTKTDAITFSVTGGDPGGANGRQFAAAESSAFPWASAAFTGVTAPVVTIGDGNLADFTAPSASNNSDGCDPLSAADAAAVVNKIVMLHWDDNDTTRRCGSATRADRLADAHAAGVIYAANDANFVDFVIGDDRIPAEIVTSAARDAVLADLRVSSTVTADLSYALHNAFSVDTPNTVNDIASFSSRGTGEFGIVKPDVAAPGVSVFSAAFGTGSDGVSFDGTSMATPHVAGAAALVLAAHPDWLAADRASTAHDNSVVPTRVKALLMNTADPVVCAQPHSSVSSCASASDVEGVTRVGAGRIDASAATAATAIAYGTATPGAISVSFGPIPLIALSQTLTRTVEVDNFASNAADYAVTPPTSNNPGAVYTAPSSVHVPAATGAVPGVATFVLTLTLNRAQLTDRRDPTSLAAAPAGDPNAIPTAYLANASGLLTLTPASGGSTLLVPVYAAPRQASSIATTTMTLAGSVFSAAGQAITLAGTGVNAGSTTSRDARQYSISDAFELQGVSGGLPLCTGSAQPPRCVPTAADSAGDLRAVGYASDGPAYDAQNLDPFSADPVGDGSVPPALGYFGIATWRPWVSPVGYQEFDVYIDVNGDGVPDADLYNDRLPGTDVFVASLDKVTMTADGPVDAGALDTELMNGASGALDTNPFNSQVMTLPFSLNALTKAVSGQSKPAQIHYFVDSFTQGADGLIDSIGDPDAGQQEMVVNPAEPAVQVIENSNQPAVCDASSGVSNCFDDQAGSELDIFADKTRATAEGVLGLLVLHHDNVGAAQVQTLPFASSMTAALAKATAPYGYRDPVTVHVASVFRTPGGTVTVTEGRTRLATGSLVAGAVSLALPARSIGRHTLTVSYTGDSSHPGLTKTLTLTVTKAASHTTLSLSGSRSVTLTAHTTVVSPGKAPVSGTVSFYDNGHRFATIRTTGTAKVRRTLSRGKHTLTVKYSGSSVLSSSSATRHQTV